MKFAPSLIDTIEVVFFLFSFLKLSMYQAQATNKSPAKSALDDSISDIDYLITIYSSTSRKPCFYFSESRFSQPESSLINCTWYKANACCKRTEVASVFLSMYTLNQASETCMNMMNYMMCYFCSPDQFIWYRGTQVSICLKFCEEMHEKCKQAEYGGRLIGDIYKDGKSFCEAQDFQVINSNQQCFDFDPTPFSESIKLNFSDKLSLFLYINILFTKFFFLI